MYCMYRCTVYVVYTYFLFQLFLCINIEGEKMQCFNASFICLFCCYLSCIKYEPLSRPCRLMQSRAAVTPSALILFLFTHWKTDRDTVSEHFIAYENQVGIESPKFQGYMSKLCSWETRKAWRTQFES